MAGELKIEIRKSQKSLTIWYVSLLMIILLNQNSMFLLINKRSRLET